MNVENLKAVAKILAESDEQESMRILSYVWIRLEYLHKLENLKLAGYVEEVRP